MSNILQFPTPMRKALEKLLPYTPPTWQSLQEEIKLAREIREEQTK